MASKYQLMVDPTPAGWAYGFPKALPEEAVLCGGEPHDLYVRGDFDLSKWIVENGYPEESLGYYSLFSVPKEELPAGPVGEWPAEMPEYYYPGNDPQE